MHTALTAKDLTSTGDPEPRKNRSEEPALNTDRHNGRDVDGVRARSAAAASPKPLEVLVADVQEKDAVPRVDRQRRWLRECRDQSPGLRLSRETGILRGLVCSSEPAAFPNRSPAL